MGRRKYTVFGFNAGETDICMFFKDCFSMDGATKDPHYLLNCIQLSCSQANVTEVTANIDGTITILERCRNRSYCSGVKICGGDGCNYALATKQRINGCS